MDQETLKILIEVVTPVVSQFIVTMIVFIKLLNNFKNTDIKNDVAMKYFKELIDNHKSEQEAKNKELEEKVDMLVNQLTASQELNIELLQEIKRIKYEKKQGD